MPRVVRSFRGRNPPASLKHMEPAGRQANDTGFRGRNPPAALKLFVGLDAAFGLEPPFPGEKSPGLIEAPWAAATERRCSPRFRGRNPPASLKPVRCGGIGLRLGTVSGGEIPRPH